MFTLIPSLPRFEDTRQPPTAASSGPGSSSASPPYRSWGRSLQIAYPSQRHRSMDRSGHALVAERESKHLPTRSRSSLSRQAPWWGEAHRTAVRRLDPQSRGYQGCPVHHAGRCGHDLSTKGPVEFAHLHPTITRQSAPWLSSKSPVRTRHSCRAAVAQGPCWPTP